MGKVPWFFSNIEMSFSAALYISKFKSITYKDLVHPYCRKDGQNYYYSGVEQPNGSFCMWGSLGVETHIFHSERILNLDIFHLTILLKIQSLFTLLRFQRRTIGKGEVMSVVFKRTDCRKVVSKKKKFYCCTQHDMAIISRKSKFYFSLLIPVCLFPNSLDNVPYKNSCLVVNTRSQNPNGFFY